MKNFEFYVGTDIVFGRDTEKYLADKIRPYGKKILMVYGGGSIKKNGLYDKLMKILEEYEIYELSGVEPNPRIESVKKGADICREKNIDLVLAVGGGSTLDCSKAICAATFYNGDPWDLVVRKAPIEKALPLATVLTLSATGSEMDAGGVISKLDTNEKRGFGSPLLLPKVSILNPENTFTVSEYQTASGSADMMAHIFESYFDKEKVFIQDEFAEALLRAVIHYAPIAVKEPTNYQARAELMWASSLAINGILGTGKNDNWTVHSIEHELSAFYDITHGVGLAILYPRWMRYILSENTLDRLHRFAVKVMGVPDGDDKEKVALNGIEALEKFFFETLNLPSNLTELGIGRENFKVMAEKAVQIGSLSNGYVALTPDDVEKIYEMCL